MKRDLNLRRNEERDLDLRRNEERSLDLRRNEERSLDRWTNEGCTDVLFHQEQGFTCNQKICIMIIVMGNCGLHPERIG